MSPLLNIVLHQPDIPQNTGNIGRTCVAVGAKLWLIRPLGFQLDEKHLLRAGMDYWDHLDWEAVDSWAEFREKLGRSGQTKKPSPLEGEGGRRPDEGERNSQTSPSPPTPLPLGERGENQSASSLALSHPRTLTPPSIWCVENPAPKLLWEATFSPGDVLVFGSETRGLPASLLNEFRATTVQLPMRPEVRSLNLASTVNTAVYEAVRQFGGKVD